MFENFKKINIQGGYFEDPVTLEVFKGADPLSIVYGRNGSGKTTIARCVKQLAESDEERTAREEKVANGDETDYTVSSDAAISDEHKKDVFVFDEDFLRDNVRVEKDGLNTIVMLGEQVELDEQINAKTEELRRKTEEYNQQDELVKKYANAGENISPLYYWNQIREGLRAEDGWAEMDRQLKGNRVMSRITDDVVKTLTDMEEPAETYEQLREKVQADLKLYLDSENAQAIAWNEEDVTLPKSLDELNALLERPLDSPELSEREQRLMTLLTMISQEPQHFEQQHTRELIEKGWAFCPLCLREIKEDDRKAIFDTLTHILNKEADEYDALLRAALETYGVIETDMPLFPGNLNERELNAAVAARDALQRVLAAVRERIEQRKRNIYKPLETAIDDQLGEAYTNARDAWKKALDQVRKCVTTFNETVSKRNKLYEKVRRENFMVARKQLAAMLTGYKMAQTNENADKTKLGVLKGEKETIENTIKALKAQKERTDIALGYINMELQYVFYSEKKVKLIAGEGCYKLVVNGKVVKPKKISVGERNVLGLCYFFAMLFSGKRDEEKYSTEYLIVIDDPVSSFDHGNRLGVMSLLRYQFHNIIKGNPNSRILVMSHDLQSVFDLVKIRGDLKGGRDRDKSFLELENKALKSQTVKNEYQKLLTHVFEYASSANPEELDEGSDLGIGNIMRRMMEAFSSFCYNQPFEAMMRSEGILNHIPEDKRDYYENFMCRLTLNSGSHEEEHTYTLNDFTPFFTKEEKQQTAKSVLLFLLYVNEPHVKAYMKPEVVAAIETWKGEEDGWMARDEV